MLAEPRARAEHAVLRAEEQGWIDGKQVFEIVAGEQRYTATIVPAYDMNHQVSGYRVQLESPLLYPTFEVAMAGALNAIDKLPSGKAVVF